MYFPRRRNVERMSLKLNYVIMFANKHNGFMFSSLGSELIKLAGTSLKFLKSFFVCAQHPNHITKDGATNLEPM